MAWKSLMTDSFMHPQLAGTKSVEIREAPRLRAVAFTAVTIAERSHLLQRPPPPRG